MTEADVAWTLVAALGAGFVAVMVVLLTTIIGVLIQDRKRINAIEYFVRYQFGRNALDGVANRANGVKQTPRDGT